MGAEREIGPINPTGRSSGRGHSPFNGLLAEIAISISEFASLTAATDKRGKQHDRSSC
jgi:hypothetical protein